MNSLLDLVTEGLLNLDFEEESERQFKQAKQTLKATKRGVVGEFANSGVEPKVWTLSEFLSRSEREDKQMMAMFSERFLLVDKLNL